MTKKPQASSVSPEFVILGFLSQQPAHGYDLHERISQELGMIWTISLSQIYNILNRLETHYLIVGVVEEQEKAPARRRFCLSPLGARRLENWLREPTQPSSHAIRVEFLTRLYFVYAVSPDQARKLIAVQIADTHAALGRLHTMLNDTPESQVFNRMGLELRMHQLTSMVDWLANCQAQLHLLPPFVADPPTNKDS
ncbi:MAG: helix-turn-helix transcriptional regulator [Anaerolineae bacterium]